MERLVGCKTRRSKVRQEDLSYPYNIDFCWIKVSQIDLPDGVFVIRRSSVRIQRLDNHKTRRSKLFNEISHIVRKKKF